MKTEKDNLKSMAAELKISVLSDSLDDLLTMASEGKWNSIRLIQEILQRETDTREENRKSMRIRKAGFTHLKHIDETEREELPLDAQKVLPELETLDFIRNARNVVLYGNAGTGKTHLATVLGVKACQNGFSVLFVTVPTLLLQLHEAKSQHKLNAMNARFEKYDLVICDEFGYVNCDKEGAQMLFNLISLRAENKATIITTNLAFNRWNEVIKDKVLVGALVDRITHKAHLVNMVGESYRVKQTKKIMEKYCTTETK